MKQNWEKEISELSAENYRFIERLLNRFKKKEIGYSETIFCITEKYEQDIKKIIQEAKQEERERILEIIDEIMGYGDTVEGGVAEGILILVKSKINK